MKYTNKTVVPKSLAEKLNAITASMRDLLGEHLPKFDGSEISRLVLHSDDDADSVYERVCPAEYLDETVWDKDGKPTVIPARLVGIVYRALSLKAMGSFPQHNDTAMVHVNEPMSDLLMLACDPDIDVINVGEVGCWDVRRNRNGDVTGRMHTKPLEGVCDVSEMSAISIDGFYGLEHTGWVTIVVKRVDAIPLEFQFGGMRVAPPVGTKLTAFGITIPADKLRSLVIKFRNASALHMFFRIGQVKQPFGASGVIDHETPTVYANYTVGPLSTQNLLPALPVMRVAATGVSPHVVKVIDTVVFAAGAVVVRFLQPTAFAWVVPGAATGKPMLFAQLATCDVDCATAINLAYNAYLRTGVWSDVVEVTKQLAVTPQNMGVHSRHDGVSCSYAPRVVCMTAAPFVKEVFDVTDVHKAMARL